MLNYLPCLGQSLSFHTDFNDKKHLQNLKKHKQFIENALKNNVKRFIFAGTCQEYGKINGKLDENMKIKPSTSYSRSKNELPALSAN